jgi:Uncharacterized conserved protein (DUF2075)
MSKAYYCTKIQDFLNTKDNEIIGKLNIGGTQFASQWTITTKSWGSSIEILKKAFTEILNANTTAANWSLFLEYEIPRLQSRIDAVILADDLIFVIEFKYDRNRFDLADIRQAEDYALDLHDFHFESKNRTIIPVLLAPLAKINKILILDNSNKPVKECQRANTETFSSIILNAYNTWHISAKEIIVANLWEQSAYSPTPTIIQAATALFSGQKVEEISNYGADNLAGTSKYIIGTINEAQQTNKKVICFVTGVPGAGKTLVGLDIVHEKELFGGTESNTAYFSGNVPLINVLREALTRDHYDRETILYKSKKLNKRPVKNDSARKVKAKIQNLHQFIKDSIGRSNPPNERIVVFDEAQRCWDSKQFTNKAKQNRNRESNPFTIEEKSEAELLFEFMNRHDGWAVIIALVGGGQEINTGEGGISEWGKALTNKFPSWEIHISPQLITGDNSTNSQKLFEIYPENLIIKSCDKLHLSVSQRSFKAANLNSWVNAVIDNNPDQAYEIAKSIQHVYPLFITRKIETAKEWLKEKRIGTKRIGLIASSGGLRLKPYGIHVREVIDEALWFLNDENDVRSSHYLEVAASEYKVQGLEIDWVCIAWDADLRRMLNAWDFKSFSGTNWQQIKGDAEKQFLLNTYRVLLTRSREGIIIFVPEGDINDPTGLPDFYNPIFEYLKGCGVIQI